MIRIPLLHLEGNLNSIAFWIGSIPIYWYAILITTAILIFVLVARKRVEKFPFSYETVLDMLLVVLPVAFIGARLYYVIFSPVPYESLQEIMWVRDGGLAIYGGIIGGGLALFLFCKAKKIEFLSMTDFIVPYLALGQAIGRWGNFMNVEAYGNMTQVPWRMEIRQNGNWIGVHPTFLYESILDFGIFLLITFLERKYRFSGFTTYCYLILYSFARLWIEGLRSDSLLFFGVRISQIVSLFLCLIFCSILLKQIKKQKRKKGKAIN